MISPISSMRSFAITNSNSAKKSAEISASKSNYQTNTLVSSNKMLSALQAYNQINFTSGISKPTNVIVGDVDFGAYEEITKEAVVDIKARAGKKGQFLNWIQELPKTQVENIDKLYSLAQSAKAGGKTDIAILGIGGSRHTTEALVNMIGKGKNAHFYSSVDPESFKRFANSLDLDKTQFLVVSKSGGTLETTVAYENAKKLMQNHTGKENVSDRFYAMTDANSERSALRRLVNKGEVSDGGLVHDDVGGRFSVFDDATIFTLAYLGVEKEDIIKLLNSSIKAQKEFMQEDINQNDALKLAVSNVDAKNNGNNKHFIEYFGDAFSGTTLWEKQLKNESLKARISTDTNIGPGYLHYNAEADLDKANNDSFFTFVYVKPQDKTTKAVLEGVTTAYKNQHPVSEIVLNDLSFETLGRYFEMKHFETLYTGNILRRQEGNITNPNEPVPEVLQPNVEIYKKEVKKALNS